MAWKQNRWGNFSSPSNSSFRPKKKKVAAWCGVSALVLTMVSISIIWLIPHKQETGQKKITRPSRSVPHKVVEYTPVTTNSSQKIGVENKIRTLRRNAPTRDDRLRAYESKLVEMRLPNTSSNRLFKSGLEQVMGWIFTTEVGEMPPPLPRIPDFDLVHLQEILESKNEISSTDSERQSDTKAMVDFAKEELKKYLEKGGAPDEFLSYYHDQLKSAYVHRRMVMEQVIKVMKEDPELAEDFLKEANSGLQEKGIKSVVIPDRIRNQIQASSTNEPQKH